jgi:hypothetical protein
MTTLLIGLAFLFGVGVCFVGLCVLVENLERIYRGESNDENNR